jgi:hypothetical protein
MRTGRPVGTKDSDETRKKKSLARIGEKNPNWGKHRSEEVKQKIRNALLGRKMPEELKRKISETSKKIWNKPDKLEFIQNLNIGRKHSEETKRKVSESKKGKPRSDELKEKLRIFHTGKSLSEETKKKLSISHIGLHAGEKHPNWNGGSSFKPYSKTWTIGFKRSIRLRDNNECKNPTCDHKIHKLVVHHIDYNKQNCHPINQITLCHRCNTKANYNRKYWEELYSSLNKQRLNDEGWM